ncbi:MAG: AarF/ABC1/UbiB kinase family protein [Symploca sp. SIO2D2]|nr:AarF/ABC1/UbiB kinase family protein [Symploca sp. SIO2D2]
MLNKKDIPTPLVEKKERKKVPVVDKLDSSRFSLFYIIWRFVLYLLKVQWRNITNKTDKQKTATELRELFEEFGGFWVKTGQLLAVRSDVFTEEICDELSRLQYGALGFPMEIVRSTIESAYGVPLEKMFDDFDEEPIAAASIAQIHTAVLRNQKTPVIVKVQRPGLDQAFQRDLDLIKVLVNVLKTFNILSYLRLDEAVLELERIFREELDYRYEASNARRIKKTLKEHKVYVPKVYDKYTKPKVLVMEYINAVLMSDYIKVSQTDPAKLRQWEEENNVDPDKVGEQLYLSLYRQIFEDNLYHADLHPGNIMLLRNSKFVLIDMGSVGSLDRGLRTIYQNYTNAVAAGDLATACDYIIRLGTDVPKVNLPTAREKMASALDVWLARSQLKGLSFKEKSLGSATGSLSQVLMGYAIPSNWGFLKLTRSFLTLDACVQFLLEDFKILKIIRKYNRQSDRRAEEKSLQPESIKASVDRFFDTVEEYNSLILPQLRHQSAPFVLTANVFALSLVVFLRTLSFVLLISAVSIFYAFLYQHYFEIVTSIHFQVAEEVAKQLPYLPYLEWVGILVVIVAMIRALLACSVILERKEYKGIGSH